MDPGSIDNVISALESIPGFDCRGGVLRIFGNKELYFKLITLFFSNHHIEQIRLALQENEFSRAYGEAHALKGSALNMGFNRIAELADAIELNLKNNQTDLAWEQLIALEELFARALEASRLPKNDGGASVSQI